MAFLLSNIAASVRASIDLEYEHEGAGNDFKELCIGCHLLVLRTVVDIFVAVVVLFGTLLVVWIFVGHFKKFTNDGA